MKKYYYFYKLCCDECEEVYVGKTCNIQDRLYDHKGRCNNINRCGYNSKVYTCIRENGGWEQWLMYIIEEGLYTEAESKNIEKKYVVKYGTLNIAIPNNDRQKYMRNFNQKNYQQNKEAKIKRTREYREKNKDAINLKNKLYYEKNKDAINLKRRLNRAKKK